MWMKICGEEHNLTCGQCKWFDVKADQDGHTSTCKRLDHKHFKFAVPWFKAYDCGQYRSTICSEFEPVVWSKWLYTHWTGLEPSDINGTVDIVVDGDQSVRYKVRYKDFFDGSFVDENGNLKWVGKEYYKASRKSPVGYELKHETQEIGEME